MSNLGFRTQTEAILALHEDGLAVAEIAERVGCSRSNVYARLKERRDVQTDWAPERLQKLARIHSAAMGVIAEVFGITADQIPHLLKAADGTSEPAAQIKAIRKLPRALHKVEPPVAQTRQYRFVGLADGQFLDGKGKFTSEAENAWVGSAEEGRQKRASWSNSRFCKLKELQS